MAGGDLTASEYSSKEEIKRLHAKLSSSRSRERQLVQMLQDAGLKLPIGTEEGVGGERSLRSTASASSADRHSDDGAAASAAAAGGGGGGVGVGVGGGGGGGGETRERGSDPNIEVSRSQHDPAAPFLKDDDIEEGGLAIQDRDRDRDRDYTARTDLEKLLAKEQREHAMKFEFDNVSFVRAAVDRGGWLAMLLLFQSFSSLILSRNVDFIKEHPTVLYFLTALVGAGGNAGNQAAVRCIRGLAQKKLNSNTMRSFLVREGWMALALSGILGIVGLGRAYLTSSSKAEMCAIGVSLMAIVLVSVLTGAVLPLGLRRCGIDPAHASTLIQVLMDIGGVWITIFITALLLDPEFIRAITGAWYGTGAIHSTIT